MKPQPPIDAVHGLEAIIDAAAGVLAEHAPWPLHLPFVCFIALLVGVMAIVAFAPETIVRAARDEAVSLRPRIGVPREIRERHFGGCNMCCGEPKARRHEEAGHPVSHRPGERQEPLECTRSKWIPAFAGMTIR